MLRVTLLSATRVARPSSVPIGDGGAELGDVMRAGIPREPEGETRVAMVPNVVPKLAKLGFEVVVENGAGALTR